MTLLRHPDYIADPDESPMACEAEGCGRECREVWFDGCRFTCKFCAGAVAVPVVVDVGDAEPVRASSAA